MSTESAAGSTGSAPSRRVGGLRLAPILGFLVLWLGGSWLILGAWLAPLLPGGWWTVAGLMALSAVPVVTLVRGRRDGSSPSAFVRLVVLRPFWYQMLMLPFLAIATLLGGLVGLPFGAGGAFGRWTLAATTAGGALLALVGYVGSKRLRVRRLDAWMPRLAGPLDGLRVVQISDLHVGPHTSRRFLDRVARVIESLRPDLLLVTGDQVDFPRDVDQFTEVFGGLGARLGSFVVPGNHDVYAGWDAVGSGLARGGLTVLANESVPVEQGGRRLWIAGTGDPAGIGRGVASAAPDLERTLERVPADDPVVVLAHNPALWPGLAELGADLTLSGHTHYGQLAVPALDWCLASPFLDLAMGWHRRGRSLLYINPGTNYWGVPFRIGALPEVTLLTLRSSGDAEPRIEESGPGEGEQRVARAGDERT